MTMILRVGLVVLAWGLLASGLRAEDKVEDQTIDPGTYNHPVKVACVGDSITQGVGTATPATQSYPAQLQAMLGKQWEVRNFGVGGRTLLRKQDPLDIKPAMKYRPDVVIILLGTNDAREVTWEKHGKEFVPDYLGVIKSFQDLESHPKIWICLPVPAFPEHWGITEKMITEKVIPAIQETSQTAKLPVIDLHSALLGKKELFPDAIHPNKEGAKIIAETVAAKLSKTAGTQR